MRYVYVALGLVPIALLYGVISLCDGGGAWWVKAGFGVLGLIVAVSNWIER